MPKLRMSTRRLAAGVMLLVFAGAAGPSEPDEAAFLAENRTAMDHMMAGMMAGPFGDVDTDFAATMIPHHQGAIDMAQAELHHGRNEGLRRIAQEIVVEQQQEIVAMRLALGHPLPTSMDSPTQSAPRSPGANQPAMSDTMSMPLSAHALNVKPKP